MEFLERACDIGNSGGWIILGLRPDHGTGVARDEAKGAQYLKRACDGGESPACEQLQQK